MVITSARLFLLEGGFRIRWRISNITVNLEFFARVLFSRNSRVIMH